MDARWSNDTVTHVDEGVVEMGVEIRVNIINGVLVALPGGSPGRVVADVDGGGGGTSRRAGGGWRIVTISLAFFLAKFFRCAAETPFRAAHWWIS